MNLWVLIPVKPFAEGKSRLASVLSGPERADLSRRMLAQLLATVVPVAGITRVVVVSRDPCVLTMATDRRAEVVREAGHDLNDALRQARRQAVEGGADAVLVLPSDLPLISKQDIEGLCVCGERGNVIAATPSRDGGTNALLLRPPEAIDFAFGAGSYHRHRDLASRAGVPFKEFHSPTLALDLDSPTDLGVLTVTGRFRAVDDVLVFTDL